MIQFRDNQAINIPQAGAAFGMVAPADIHHRDLLREGGRFSRCSGKRRRMSKWPYSCSMVPVCPVVDHGGGPGEGRPERTGTPTTCPPTAGGPAARLWATLVLQRALSS